MSLGLTGGGRGSAAEINGSHEPHPRIVRELHPNSVFFCVVIIFLDGISPYVLSVLPLGTLFAPRTIVYLINTLGWGTEGGFYLLSPALDIFLMIGARGARGARSLALVPCRGVDKMTSRGPFKLQPVWECWLRKTLRMRRVTEIVLHWGDRSRDETR